jgi:hypothetical protein
VLLSANADGSYLCTGWNCLLDGGDKRDPPVLRILDVLPRMGSTAFSHDLARIGSDGENLGGLSTGVDSEHNLVRHRFPHTH